MKICVIGGGGYVGLITSIGFALLEHSVVGVDVNSQVVDDLQDGRVPIHEEGLEDALNKALSDHNLYFTTDLVRGLKDADVVFVTVGSPSTHDGSPDLSQVRQVAQLIAETINSYTLVAIKSTVPIGTIEMIRALLDARQADRDAVDVVVNPEFLREGRALYDFFFPSRIVIGADSDKARHRMHELYAPFVGKDAARRDHLSIGMAHNVPIVDTSIDNALMIKYASNAFLATRVSFINEVAAICEELGADIIEVVKGLGYDPRIGPDYLNAGIGFGGPCLEKDLQALIHIASQRGYKADFFQSVLDRNDEQVRSIINSARELLGSDFSGKKIAIYGLAFKPGTNDVRTSLSLRIIQELRSERAEVYGHDPIAVPVARKLMPDVFFSEDPYEVIKDADIAMLLTGWPEYREFDFTYIRELMRQPKFIDGINFLDRKTLQSAGLIHRGVGWNLGSTLPDEV